MGFLRKLLGSSPKDKPGKDKPGHVDHSASLKFKTITDQYNNLKEVQRALRDNGLESSQLIVGIDFTKSNEWTGRVSFNGRSLHELGPKPNPYEQAIAIIGNTLAPFDDDNLIPAYGFGDVTTRDKSVFPLFADDAPARGFQSLLQRYRTITPYLDLCGPTSFGPLIWQAIQTVIDSGMQYHILLLVADGQVTILRNGEQSPQLKDTVEAIVAASHFPLSIVMVGVGDGPWEQMNEFDDQLPSRQFDNFQFVNFTQLMSETQGYSQDRREALFALRALMEVPEQFKAVLARNLVGARPRSNLLPRGIKDKLKPLPLAVDILASEEPPVPAAPALGAAPAFGVVPSFGSARYPGFDPTPQQAYPGFAQQDAYAPCAAMQPPAGYPGVPAAAQYPYASARDVAPPSSCASNMPYPNMYGGGASGSPPLSSASHFPPISAAHHHPLQPAATPRDVGYAAPSAPPCSAMMNPNAASQAQHLQNANPMFLCPITKIVMTDPVMAADGYTYESTAITAWLASHDTSPMTGAALPHTNLTPNHTLRSAIMEWRQAQQGGKQT